MAGRTRRALQSKRYGTEMALSAVIKQFGEAMIMGMGRARESRPLATRKVFNTFELAEMVFAKLHLKDLMKAMRVCEKFYDTIIGSKMALCWLELSSYWGEKHTPFSRFLAYSIVFCGSPLGFRNQKFYVRDVTSMVRDGRIKLRVRYPRAIAKTPSTIIKPSISGNLWRQMRICSAAVEIEVERLKFPPDEAPTVFGCDTTLGELYDWLCEEGSSE